MEFPKCKKTHQAINHINMNRSTMGEYQLTGKNAINGPINFKTITAVFFEATLYIINS